MANIILQHVKQKRINDDLHSGRERGVPHKQRVTVRYRENRKGEYIYIERMRWRIGYCLQS